MNTSPEPPRIGDRDEIAADRDSAADAQDRAAQARDERAEERDQRAESREEHAGQINGGSAADRSGARRDRRAARDDRRNAADDRRAGRTERSRSATERADQDLDDLTGTYRREPGFVELERSIAQARRRRQSFVLAFLDVDGLKATNDSLGHDAGDQLLRQVAASIRTVVRASDVLVRYGGDEFLCGLVDVSLGEAAQRFHRANAALAAHQASITAGLAELATGERLEALVARADQAMYAAREGRGDGGRGS